MLVFLLMIIGQQRKKLQEKLKLYSRTSLITSVLKYICASARDFGIALASIEDSVESVQGAAPP